MWFYRVVVTADSRQREHKRFCVLHAVTHSSRYLRRCLKVAVHTLVYKMVSSVNVARLRKIGEAKGRFAHDVNSVLVCGRFNFIEHQLC